MNIVEALFEIFRVLPVLLLVFFISSLSTISVSNMDKKDTDRFAIELSENIINSKLTVERTIFNHSELEKYHNTKTEPYVRHCQFAYHLLIEDLENNKIFQFGYSTANKENAAVIEAPVSLYYNDKTVPAKMTLVVYDSWLARITCLIENAYKSKKAQEIAIPWKNVMPVRNKDDDAATNQVCFYGKTLDKKIYDSDCRYLPDSPEIHFISPSKVNKAEVVLKAVPIRTGVSLPNDGKCSDISDSWISEKSETIIALCVDDVK
ncbi:MAG: hypothetical protein V1900_00085 [Candidatus Aenigmatarchaeota archaeon]